MANFSAYSIEIVLKMIESRFGKDWHKKFFLKTDMGADGKIQAEIYPINSREISMKEIDEIIIKDADFDEAEIEDVYKEIQEEYRAPEITVKISEDLMNACISIIPGTISVKYDKEYLIELLNKNGIVFGIDSEMLSEISKKNIANGIDGLTVAAGNPPGKSSDAKIKLNFPKDGYINIEKDENEKIDYKKTKEIFQCKTGDVLVEKIPMIQGYNGMTVTGENIQAEFARDLDLSQLIGNKKSLGISDDGLKIISKKDGQPYLSDLGKIHIQEIFIVNKNLDYSVGDIDFDGTVVIQGNVELPFEVKAKGDIIIDGLLIDTRIYSERSILVRQGAYGNGNGRMVAKKGITSKYLNNLTVFCDEDIVCEDYIMNSIVLCGGNLLVKGRGKIAGGSVLCGKSISVKIAGAVGGTPTLIGIDIDYRKKKFEMEKFQKISSYLNNLGKLSAVLDKIIAEIKNTTEKEKIEEMMRTMAKIKLSKNKYILLIEETKNQTLKEEIKSSGKKESFLTIFEKAFEGVKIQVRNDILKLPADIGASKITYDDLKKRIVAKPISKWEI